MGSFALLGAFFSFMFIVTLYLQEVLHYTPLLASLALLPAGIASIPVCVLLTPRLVNRLGMRLSAVLGLLCLALGIALFTRIGPSSDYPGVILLPTLVTIALGMSIGFPSLSIAAVSGIANEEQGLVAGLQSTALQVGGTLAGDYDRRGSGQQCADPGGCVARLSRSGAGSTHWLPSRTAGDRPGGDPASASRSAAGLRGRGCSSTLMGCRLTPMVKRKRSPPPGW